MRNVSNLAIRPVFDLTVANCLETIAICLKLTVDTKASCVMNRPRAIALLSIWLHRLGLPCYLPPQFGKAMEKDNDRFSQGWFRA